MRPCAAGEQRTGMPKKATAGQRSCARCPWPRARDQRRQILHLGEEVCGPGLERLRELRQFARGERLVVDRPLEPYILREIAQKSCKALSAARAQSVKRTQAAF